MPREYAKWHQCQLDDPDFLAMPAEAYRIFGLAVAMAARVDDDGACGPVKRFAWVIHEDVEDVEKWVEQTDGRLTITRGELFVRDWSQWQTKAWDPTAKERKQRYLERQGTIRNSAERNGTGGNGPKHKESKKSKESKLTHEGGSEAAWDFVPVGLAARFGDAEVYRKDGKHNALVGRIIGAVGKLAEDDPEVARGILRRFVEHQRSSRGIQTLTLSNFSARLNNWWAELPPERGDDSAGSPEWVNYGENPPEWMGGE